MSSCSSIRFPPSAVLEHHRPVYLEDIELVLSLSSSHVVIGIFLLNIEEFKTLFQYYKQSVRIEIAKCIQFYYKITIGETLYLPNLMCFLIFWCN